MHYLILAFEASREAEERALEYRILAREAELKAFKSQIDPHFLFNSLNSISALCGVRPADARSMSQRLASFLRSSLRLGGRNRIPLAEELELVDVYLSIEQVRFGSRLRVEKDVDPSCADCAVPPLILQPLVENAVRHGIASLIDGGTVSISASRTATHLIVVVENDYDPEERSSTGEGIGMENVRGRLRTSFDERAVFLAQPQDGRFRVELRIPCDQATEGGDR